MADPILIAKNAAAQITLLPVMSNRHGLVAGATGTGKTVTLQALAEGFSRIGVPVFAADVKGDLAGASQPGGGNTRVDARLGELGLTTGWDTTPCPVMLWDVFGVSGQPVRATVSEMGPLLLARMLNLNDVQEGVLNVAFRAADEAGLLLLDLKDLRAVLSYCSEHADELQREYGNVSPASVGTIQRELLTLETQGGDKLFGEPALDLNDLMRTDVSGRGIISLLAADQLMQSPQVYSTMLLWLLSELFEKLPEVGDLEKPKLVFFFDEAHLLFTDAPKPLLQKIEQVIRLVRSKGVGIYFVTQNPTDIPDNVLGQLGNKVQHALRAFTPRDQKAVDAMAQTFRPNPAVDVATAVTQLGVGEALLSVLDSTGSPTPVERAWVVPPHGHIGAITPEQRAAIRATSPVGTKYDVIQDRESAYERLKAQAAAEAAAAGGGVGAPAIGVVPPVPAAAAPAPAAAPAQAPVGAPVPPGNYPTAPATPGMYSAPGYSAPVPTGYPAGVPAPGGYPAGVPNPGGYPAGVPMPGTAYPATFPAAGPAPAATPTQAPAPRGKAGPDAGAAFAGAAGGLIGAFGKSALRSFGTVMGREISRGVLGSMKR
jgi:DNA helicase HerA-like ATPase